MSRHRKRGLWGLIVPIILLVGMSLWHWVSTPNFDDIYQKALHGDSRSQFELAKMHIWGKGVKKDPIQAHKWFMKAAEQGHAEAQEAVGESYREGWGGEKDITKAIVWYEKAAKQGDTYAQDDLFDIYLKRKDYSKAAYWVTKAAKSGNPGAQSNLGYLYYYGYGVPQDYQQSFYWTKKAADSGLGQAKANLAEIYARGLWVKKDPQKALELYKDAVGHKHISAAVNVGYIYAHGLGVAKDQELANYWYSRFLTEATADDLYKTGNSFITGQFTEISKPDAYLWMQYAARQGSKEAAIKLEKLQQELNAAEKSKMDQQMAAIKTGLSLPER